MTGMKLASLHKNKLVPSYERIHVVTKAIQDALQYFNNQEKPDPTLVTYDSRSYVRRDQVMSFILRAVRELPREWKMSVQIKRAGGGFHFLLIRFEDMNLTLVPMHLPLHVKTPRPSGYRGEMSAFNYAVMQAHGMQEEMDFQTHLTVHLGEIEITTSPLMTDDIMDIPFGLFLLYDGTNMKAPLRIAALTPEQDRFIFCDKVEMLKELDAEQAKDTAERPVAKKRKRAVQLDTSLLEDYTQTPNVVLKKTKREKRTDV